MISCALPVLSFAALIVAQSSTVNLFIPFADQQSLVASIAGSDSTATSYVVNCPTPDASARFAAATGDGSDDGDADVECGFPNPFTMVQGPSTVHYVLELDEVGVETFDCKLMGTTQAVCAATASGSGLLSVSNPVPALETTTFAGSDIQFFPVVITAGSATAKQTASASAKTTATASTSAKSGQTSGTSSSAVAKSTNAAMQGGPVFGAGIVGALGVAVAGAML